MPNVATIIPVHRACRRNTFRSSVLAIACLSVPVAARAQDPTSTTPTLIQEVEGEPRPGQSGATATIGTQLQTGRTNTRGWTISATAAHTTRKKDLVRLDFDANFASYRNPPEPDYSQIEDNQRLRFTYIRPINRRLVFLGFSGWRRDKVLALKYRAEVEGGLGFHVVETPRTYVMVGSSFSLGHESRLYTSEASGVRDLGFLEVVTHHVTPVLSASESLMVKTDLSDSSDRTTAFKAAFMARVSKHVGMQIYFQHQYDSLHQPTVSASQSELGAGVQITFSAAPPKPTP